jgi:hypothetical protein
MECKKRRAGILFKVLDPSFPFARLDIRIESRDSDFQNGDLCYLKKQ